MERSKRKMWSIAPEHGEMISLTWSVKETQCLKEICQTKNNNTVEAA
jgi:hypothetical protein